MDYNQINLFLEKFKKILFQKEEAYSAIIEVITKHISYPINANMISTKGGIIYIKGSPMLRNEILIHKRGILQDLSNIVPQSRFTDIK